MQLADPLSSHRTGDRSPVMYRSPDESEVITTEGKDVPTIEGQDINERDDRTKSESTVDEQSRIPDLKHEHDRK